MSPARGLPGPYVPPGVLNDYLPPRFRRRAHRPPLLETFAAINGPALCGLKGNRSFLPALGAGGLRLGALKAAASSAPSARLDLHALQRLGSFLNPLSAKNICSPAVKTNSALHSEHFRTLSLYSMSGSEAPRQLRSWQLAVPGETGLGESRDGASVKMRSACQLVPCRPKTPRVILPSRPDVIHLSTLLLPKPFTR